MQQAKSKRRGRLILGICGAPAAGKSTLAESLVNTWNHRFAKTAALVPMDGYHLSNEKLQQMGLWELKGKPETFDAHAFVQKIKEIRSSPAEKHFCPLFDRSSESSIENAIVVGEEHELVVVEGNYLLLDFPPWDELRELFDLVWYIQSAKKTIYPRLLARHMQGGKSEKQSKEKLASTDLPNAKLIAKTAVRADLLIESEELLGPAQRKKQI